MALIKCSNCGHVISDKANKCPKCGMPNQKKEKAAEITKTRNDITITHNEEKRYKLQKSQKSVMTIVLGSIVVAII